MGSKIIITIEFCGMWDCSECTAFITLGADKVVDKFLRENTAGEEVIVILFKSVKSLIE